MANDALELESVGRDDQDSIHTFSLMGLPIHHPGLRRTRMIKNAHMETRIEMFSGQDQGSGQIEIGEIPDHFQGDASLKDDIALLKGLSILPSFDCYTLRRGLRQQGVQIEQDTAFKLSDSKIQELFPLMRRITRPLIKQLYGDGGLDVSDTQTLLELVRNPDQDKVLNRLDEMAATLGVSVARLPNYLEDFGDLYLSLSYFESYFLEMGPKVDQLLVWMQDVAENSHLRNDNYAQKSFIDSGRRVRYLKDNLETRFKNLSEATTLNWDRLDVGMFKTVQSSILKEQIYLATGLCGLAVKIYEWERVFPNAGGSPDRCLDFVVSELRPGLDNLVRALPKVEAAGGKGKTRSERVW